MNNEDFNAMLAGFPEAMRYRAGQKTTLRVSRMAFAPVDLKPEEIRDIRVKLNLTQETFAEFLGASVGTVRSWEQGARKPQTSALRLLVIAKEKPALLLQKSA